MRWTRGQGVQRLFSPLSFEESVPLRVCSDGTAIVGWVQYFADAGASQIWTANGSVALWKLGQFERSPTQGKPGGCSSDGRVIAGFYSWNVMSRSLPFSSRGGSGLFVLGDAPDAAQTIENAAKAAGWAITEVTGVSDDGKVIAGNGLHGIDREGWIAHLP